MEERFFNVQKEAGDRLNLNIDASTKLLGVIGSPIAQSISPRMHNLAFSYLGLNYVYLAFDVDNNNLEDAINALRTLDVKGFNVTMPNKKKVIPLLDEISIEAQMIGSVNTVLNDNGKLIGYNTDGKGYVRSLREEGIDINGSKIVIVGAGGATSSVAIQLALDGAKEIYIMNRTYESALQITEKIQANIPTCKSIALELDESKLHEVLYDKDILINSTSIGMSPREDECIISSPEILYTNLIVSDLIYKPRKTKLLSYGEEKGCKIINGIGMVICQGAEAFKIWTGQEMPVKYIYEKLMIDK